MDTTIPNIPILWMFSIVIKSEWKTENFKKTKKQKIYFHIISIGFANFTVWILVHRCVLEEGEYQKLFIKDCRKLISASFLFFFSSERLIKIIFSGFGLGLSIYIKKEIVLKNNKKFTLLVNLKNLNKQFIFFFLILLVYPVNFWVFFQIVPKMKHQKIA